MGLKMTALGARLIEITPLEDNMKINRWSLFFVFTSILLASRFTAVNAQTITTTTNWAPTSCSVPAPAEVFFYTGTGTTSGDVAAVKDLLNLMKLTYSEVSASQMNCIQESNIAGRFKLILFPGGNSIDISAALNASALAAVHNAVTNDGVPYLGICAGDFMAGAWGSSSHKAFNLTNGVSFNVYDHGAITGVPISFPKQATLDITLWDGPADKGWGSVVGKFSDGTPAIVEGKSGKGFVLLSGVHPEASLTGWCKGSACADNKLDVAYAETLVNAALHSTPLPSFSN
jgi:hypothetical protein